MDIELRVNNLYEIERFDINDNKIDGNLSIIEALELYYKTDIIIRNIVVPDNIKLLLSESFIKILSLIKDKDNILESDFFELNICIPYRARNNNNFRKIQLKDFCNNIIDFLNKKEYKITFKIIILEQNNDLNFNRGLLLNIGFLENENNFSSKIQYYCHHNVDLFPEDINLDYSYIEPNNIRDLFGYQGGLGGICFINRNDFKDINGFPNDMFGWGSEDVCIKQRIDKKNIKINRDSYNIGIKELNHPRDGSFNSINLSKMKSNETGLNNIEYIINEKHIGKIVFDENDILENSNFVHYLVDFN